jgi:hypothetical protein
MPKWCVFRRARDLLSAMCYGVIVGNMHRTKIVFFPICNIVEGTLP